MVVLVTHTGSLKGKRTATGDLVSASFLHFKTLLMNHSCNWPPHTMKVSIWACVCVNSLALTQINKNNLVLLWQVFDTSQANALTKYTMDTYFRHFKLFQVNNGISRLRSWHVD
jgi:hypothetical protein